jgi:hypothetical protein
MESSRKWKTRKPRPKKPHTGCDFKTSNSIPISGNFHHVRNPRRTPAKRTDTENETETDGRQRDKERERGRERERERGNTDE